MYVYPALGSYMTDTLMSHQGSLVICKNCSSPKIVKHGYNYTNRGKIQRYFCKVCNHNFN